MMRASVLGTAALVRPVATVGASQSEEYWQELREDHLGMVGSSKAMVALRTALRRVGDSERPVLVCGPTGSGKQLVIEALHRLRAMNRPVSARGGGTSPLIVVGCAGIVEAELEFLLFGNDRARGMLSAAEDGTLVLEEVGALSPSLQAKMVRILEHGTYRPLGALTERRFQARLIASSVRPLERAVRDGLFRADLFYRLSSAIVAVPSLSERREDVPALVNHFVRQIGSSVRFTDDALEALGQRAWDGNVRELRNVVERACGASQDGTAVRAQDIASLAVATPGPTLRADSLAAFAAEILGSLPGNKLEAVEAALISQAMAISGGNKTAAARLLGVHRKSVERKLDKYKRRAPAKVSAAPGAEAEGSAPTSRDTLRARAIPASPLPTLAS